MWGISHGFSMTFIFTGGVGLQRANSNVHYAWGYQYNGSKWENKYVTGGYVRPMLVVGLA